MAYGLFDKMSDRGKTLLFKNLIQMPKPYILIDKPLFINEDGKPFKFKGKNDEKDYIDICEDIWGAVPCDVTWAMQTKIYKIGL